MKPTYLKTAVLVIFLIASGIAYNQNSPQDEVLYELKPLQNNAFTYGEKLKYRVHYGFLTGGYADFDVSDKPEMYNNRPVYKIKASGRSTGVVDAMFSVKDEFVSYMDTEALVPWKATKNVKEGNYKDLDVILFDHRRRIAQSTNRGQLSIPEGTKDIISTLYYARSLDMTKANPGDVFPITFYLDNKNYEFRFKFVGRETIKIGSGKYKALKVKPQVIAMWVTDDENKIPLLVESEIWVGSLKAELIEMSGLRNPLNSKIK
jgi:hypothetical protein